MHVTEMMTYDWLCPCLFMSAVSEVLSCK